MWRSRRRGIRRGSWALAAALLLGACGSGGQGGGQAAQAADPEEAWMDRAEVRVTEDPCAGHDTVELVGVGAEMRSVSYTDTFAPERAACSSQ